MQARYFRYLFENAVGGIVQSGSIWDNIRGETYNYMYVSGANTDGPAFQKISSKKVLQSCADKKVDSFVLGTYTLPTLQKMIDTLETRKIHTMVLPYVPPVDRLMLTYLSVIGGTRLPKVERFLRNPQRFLREQGVENVFFVYGNGPQIQQGIRERKSGLTKLSGGIAFTLQKSDILSKIEQLEGEPVPVWKAGYWVTCDWLFYFGCYGMDLDSVMKFSEEHFFLNAKDVLTGRNLKENIWDRVRNAIPIYLRYFNSIADVSITMFVGPVHCRKEHYDGKSFGKFMSKDNHCIPCIMPGGTDCEITCLYQEDFTAFRKNSLLMPQHIMGNLLLGNVNLNQVLLEVMKRYDIIKRGIRCITIPNCGKEGNWNSQAAELFSTNQSKYWVSGDIHQMDGNVLKDILSANAYNKILNINEEFGYCFSGLLVPLDGEDII